MFWLGILKPTGRSMPSMVFNAERQPLGFAFFTTKEKLDSYLQEQTQLEYEAHELDKTLKAEDFIEVVISHFSAVFNDVEKAAAISMEGIPIFIDPPRTKMEATDTPSFQSLYSFLAANLPQLGNRNIKNVKVVQHEGYTFLVNESLIDHTFVAIIKRGTFNSTEEFAGAKVDDKDQYMTGFLSTAVDAELGALAIIDSLNEMKEESADGESPAGAQPTNVSAV